MSLMLPHLFRTDSQQIIETQHAQERQSARCEHYVHNELEEVLHVAMANTVVDPWTVVVHLEDAEVALTAMVSTCRLPCFLAFALLTVFHLHEFAHEGRCHALFDASRVREGRS